MIRGISHGMSGKPVFWTGPSSQTRLRGSVPTFSAEATQKPGWRKHLGWFPVLTHAIGGSLLIATSLWPGKPLPHKPEAKTTEVKQAAVSNKTPLEQDVNEMRQTLNRLGWTLTSIGMMAGCVNGVLLGKKNKQPSMVLSSVANMMTVPFIIVHPALLPRVAFSFFSGIWLAGFASKTRNEFCLKPGEKPREFDMKALWNKAALEGKLPEGTPATPRNLSKAWGDEVLSALKFVGDDHVLMVQDVGKTMGKAVSKSRQIPKAVETEFNTFKAFLSRQSHNPPKLLQPSALQGQVGGMLLYMGSIPMLFLGGQPNAVCEAMLALGGLTSNMTMFATAINKKENAMLVGIPLGALGTSQMHTDAGSGLGYLCSATIQNYFRKEINNQFDNKKSEEAPKPL